MMNSKNMQLSGIVGADEIDQPVADRAKSMEKFSDGIVPYNAETFLKMKVTDTWKKYENILSWGKGQCLAILDDGCDLSVPEWQTSLPWGKKVIATYNSIDANADPTPIPPGYHGTSVGYPSSLNYNEVCGVAYNNFVAHVRCASIVHLKEDESVSIAAGLQWVIDNYDKYHITAINLSVLDDFEHSEPVHTVIDKKLIELKKLGIWVSAPCGNNGYTKGISWPACQPYCFAIGAIMADSNKVYLDRYKNTDILVASPATSSSNAYIAASSMILREAIEVTNFNWRSYADNLPDAIMRIFKATGKTVYDDEGGLYFESLDLLASVDCIFEHISGSKG